MATIQDLISQYENKNIANINSKKYRAGLGSPQLSAELLKALKVPENKTLGDLFPAGVPGGSGTDYYDNTVKFFGGDPNNPQTRIGGAFGDYVGKPLLSLAEDTVKLGGAFGLDRLKGNSITDNINSYLFGTPESTRQNLGQDILSQIQEENFMSSVPKSDKEIQEKSQIDSLSGGGGGDQVISPDNQLIGTKGKFSDPEAEAALAEMQQKIKENTQLGDMSQEGADMEVITSEMREPVLSAEEKKAQAQQSLFKSSMDDITNIYGDGTKKDTSRKTLDEYKADFAKATGIDVSGEPDNKLALMSLGLSLMQNKAGKDFNLSNIIGSAGEAGQAAMPLFQKAKDDARAGQVAAGKYALQETKADSLAKLATAKEKRAALTGLSKEFREYGQKYALAQMKHVNALNIKELEMRAKGIEPKGTITRQTLNGFPTLKISKGFVASNKNNSVYLQAPEDAKLHANAYVGLLEAENSIDKMKTIFTEMDKNPGPQAYNTVKDRFFRLLKPLGIGNEDYTKDINFTEKEYNSLSGESRIKMIQDRLISQYKKFLTKESGNGVSEGDIKRLQILVGKISLTAPFKENMARLDELAKIFKQPRTTLEGTFAEFGKRKNHMSDDSYKDTMNIINKAISTGTEDLYSSGFNDDGVFTIDLRKK
tara:strand:+ start:58 stop:2016 length:1959 start_codon:yes stop_codon:yes gene_type:complete